jgi:hypothetical protein
MSLQLRAAILTLRQRRALNLPAAEESSLAWRRLFDRRDRGIT